MACLLAGGVVLFCCCRGCCNVEVQLVVLVSGGGRFVGRTSLGANMSAQEKKDVEEEKPCDICMLMLPVTEFSNKQWKRDSSRRCNSCFMGKCSVCARTLACAEYSSKQWKLGKNRRCRVCVKSDKFCVVNTSDVMAAQKLREAEN